MTTTPRQKACIACADSKRRCDKQLPECQRCFDREVNCVYPRSKKRRDTRDLSIGRDAGDTFTPGQYHAGAINFDLEEWSTRMAPNSTNPFPEVLPTLGPILAKPGPNLSEDAIIFDADGLSGGLTPWFLQDETWHLQHSDENVACATFVELEPLVQSVEKMLETWVNDGHNSFIHRRLYRLGMPSDLQHAFTVLSSYFCRKPATKDLILQIAMDRLSALVNQHFSIVSQGIQSIQAHLARVQTLFIYEFILLFDGSVRARASGERRLPVFRQWVLQMQEEVRGYRGEGDLMGLDSPQWAITEFDRQYNASTELWNEWILTESVRRTQVIANTISNIYDIMVFGSAECSGAVMFTACRGLWEAESAFQWFELSCSKLPLLVPSLRPSSLISQYNAEDIDDFVKLFWTFVVGADKIQCWIERSKHNV